MSLVSYQNDYRVMLEVLVVMMIFKMIFKKEMIKKMMIKKMMIRVPQDRAGEKLWSKKQSTQKRIYLCDDQKSP